MLGCALMLAVAVLVGRETAAAMLRPALASLIIVSTAVLGLVLINVREAIGRLSSRRRLLGIGSAALVVGAVIPLGLLLAGGTASMLAAVVLILLGSLTIRYQIVAAPHG
jgi:hypothetical protein